MTQIKKDNFIGSNGEINANNDPEFSSPFDPTYWLTQLEDYFRENNFLTSANLIKEAHSQWIVEKQEKKVKV